MNAQLPLGLALPTRQRGLLTALCIVAAVLSVETLCMSYLIQYTPVDSVTGVARIVRGAQHWLFRLVIAYLASLAIMVYLRGSPTLGTTLATPLQARVRTGWLLVHMLLLLPFAFLSAAVYRVASAATFAALQIAWHACGAGVVLSLCAAMVPANVWRRVIRQTETLPYHALPPAVAAVAAIRGSQLLWGHAARLTFHIVQLMLRPFFPALQDDPAALTLATANFAVTISEVCSGLEGVGLMLAFCITWLCLFRREYRFPRALVIVPAAVLLIFLLNAVRIAALVIIGDAGYQGIATVGFHSQAGWIAFNLAAFGVAMVSKRSAWLHRDASPPVPKSSDATAAYLLPLLTILAAGMIAHALSSGFDLLYPLRLAGAAVVLAALRHHYAALDWRFSWRACWVGGLVFCVWVAFGRSVTSSAGMPESLVQLPASARALWIACRVLAAVVTVPLAEELAYRGYLLRRIVSPNFEQVPWRAIRWPALLLSALAFGITHGGMWLPGIFAGVAYGALAIKTGRIGECIVAHGVTNALLAGYVLLFDQWQLW